MTKLTKIFDTPYGEKIKDEFIDNGFGDIVATSEAHLEVDTDALRRTALRFYGQRRQDNDLVDEPYTAPSEELPANPVSAGSALGKAKSSRDLYQVAALVPQRFNTTVQDSWEGEAYEKFRAHIWALKALTAQEASRLEDIGDLLYEFSRQMDEHQVATVDTYTGAMTIFKTLQGWVSDPATYVKAARAWYTIAKSIYDMNQKAKEAFDANAVHVGKLSELVLGLREPDVMSPHSAASVKKRTYPKGPEDWDRKEPFE